MNLMDVQFIQRHYFQYHGITFILVLNSELRYENISTCILYIKYLCILSTHVFSYLPLDVTDKRTSQQCTVINCEWQQHFCYNVWTLNENLVKNYDNHTAWNQKYLIFLFFRHFWHSHLYKNWNKNMFSYFTNYGFSYYDIYGFFARNCKCHFHDS